MLSGDEVHWLHSTIHLCHDVKLWPCNHAVQSQSVYWAKAWTIWKGPVAHGFEADIFLPHDLAGDGVSDS